MTELSAAVSPTATSVVMPDGQRPIRHLQRDGANVHDARLNAGKALALDPPSRNSPPMQRYWVYILASRKNGVLYTGVTNNLAARVHQHRNGEGSLFARKYRVLRLVYAESFNDVQEALAAEKRLKKWRRAWKVELIEKANPEWCDLMEDRG